MRPTQKRMRDGKVNHLQNTYTNLRIRPKQELFPTERQQTCQRHKIAPISHDIGTEQQTQLEQYKQETSFVLKTRDQTQYVYTIQTYPISQTNKPSGTPSYTKTKHYTMDSHSSRQLQT